MSDNEVRELREELQAFKLDVVQRLARIETKLEGGSAPPGSANEDGPTQALGRVSAAMVELGKLALQVIAAVVAALIAVQRGGTP